MRIVTDGKLRRLVARLLRARAEGQKVIVFSQFTDTLAYVDSVLRARLSSRQEWAIVTGLLGADVGRAVRHEDVLALVDRSALVSGETEDRDAVIHAFAPFYRLGPSRPRLPGASAFEQQQLDALWTNGWTQALKQPTDVLFATDVLAEGVNLQDAALLINFDVHWNPVRMIQRAGRIDRRLNPAIEEATSFPDLEALARDLGVPPPRYWWHEHTGAAPITVNLLLPDELEAELQLRERIANKTLAIDFTLGLEQGTGAEADWMAAYRYQGISALNAWQGDRAIEQIAGYQQRLRRLMNERGIDAEWLAAWNGWLREVGGRRDDRILAWAQLGRKGGETTVYTRQLQPRLVDGVPHWLWTTAKPADSLLNFWLALDSKTFPAATRTGLAFSEDASRPIAAEDLLAVSRRLVDEDTALEELGDMRRPLLQGASAISAGFFEAEPDRRAIAVSGFRLLQLRRVDEAAPVTSSEAAC
ncbi:MAG: SWF/SNF helicase family protein [Deltaproteobacteria bacterium]|nr:SWF/SNF helicase family protein [Deltaproteobacteria bacterium]